MVEDFVDVYGLRMKDFQDMVEVTDNLGKLFPLTFVSLAVSENIASSVLVSSILLKLHVPNSSKAHWRRRSEGGTLDPLLQCALTGIVETRMEKARIRWFVMFSDS